MIKHPNINWLLNHKINYIGSNLIDYNIYKIFDIIGYDDNNVYIIYLKPQFSEFNFKETLINSITDTHIINTINNYNVDEDKNDDDNEDNDDEEDKKYDKISNDYKKFSNKNIITVVFGLNLIDYIKFDWKDKDTQENLINKYNSEIKIIIADNIIESYNNDSCYYYYKYSKNNKKDIKDIINKLKENKEVKQMPKFIMDFFKDMRKNKNTNYDDINIFNEKLKEIIKDDIYDFIDI